MVALTAPDIGTMRETSGVTSSIASTAMSAEIAGEASGSRSIHDAGSLSWSVVSLRAGNGCIRTMRPRTVRLKPSAYCTSSCCVAGVDRSCQHHAPAAIHNPARGTAATRNDHCSAMIVVQQRSVVADTSRGTGNQLCATTMPAANQHKAASSGILRNRSRSIVVAQYCSAWPVRILLLPRISSAS